MHHKMIYCRVSQDKWNMSILSHLDLVIIFFPPWLAFWQFSLFHSAILCATGRQGVELFPKSGQCCVERNYSWKGTFFGADSPHSGKEAGVVNMISGKWKHREIRARVSQSVEMFFPDDSRDTEIFLSHRSSWAGEILHPVLLSCRRRPCSRLWIPCALDKNGVAMLIWHLVNLCRNKKTNQTKRPCMQSLVGLTLSK